MYAYRRILAGLIWLTVCAAVDAGVFTVSGRQILLNGSAFEVRGMCYQPTPIGQDPSAGPPYGDYYTAGYAPLWARDFENLRMMGANVVRVYGWTPGANHSAFLDAAYNSGERSLYLLINKWINPSTDWNNTDAVNALVSEWETIAAELKNHPSVMGFLVGNETNWQEGNGFDSAFWAAMNQIAGAIKAEAPNKLVSVAVTDALGQVQTYDASMTHLDFWALQVYRGAGFGSFFSDYADRSAKPLIVTEFGYDAYDAAAGAEFADDAGFPADAMENLWNELRENRSIASGGCVFEYADEWWKAGNAFIQDAPPGWPAPFVDGEGNEEWWGVFRVLDNGTEPDLLEPRAMFYRLSAMWNEPYSPADILIGMSNDLPEISFSYPKHFRDQIMQLEISADLKSWTQTADNSRSLYLESFTPKIELASIETGQTVNVTFLHNPAAVGPFTPANLLSNGDFESGSTLGWTTLGTASSVVARDGSFSLQLSSPGGFTVPSAYLKLPAVQGEEFRFSGFMYTPTTLPEDSTFGLFKIVFADAAGNALQPAMVGTGRFADPAYPGAESLPLLNAASPAGVWNHSEVQAVAPDNTASVSFFVINVDQSANTMYFDTLNAVPVTDLPDIDNAVFFRVGNSGR